MKMLPAVDGFPPHPVLRDRARLGPAEAGMAATGVVNKGHVLLVALHGAGGDEPYYLVVVVTDTEEVQVEVDAVTGCAQVVRHDEEGSCSH